MALFGKPKAGGFMDEIRCDEPSYLIWKWHPAGSELGNNNRENHHAKGDNHIYVSFDLDNDPQTYNAAHHHRLRRHNHRTRHNQSRCFKNDKACQNLYSFSKINKIKIDHDTQKQNDRNDNAGV